MSESSLRYFTAETLVSLVLFESQVMNFYQILESKADKLPWSTNTEEIDQQLTGPEEAPG